MDPQKKTQQRQQLLSVLSRSSLKSIQEHWSQLSIKPEYQQLKAPESGMVMVKAKAGGTGQDFNMGEMTVTRTVIQLNSGEVGYGYTQGRDKQKSKLIALIDACHQLAEYTEKITHHLMQPLEAKLDENYQKVQEKTNSSKVDFFTMVRGA